MKISAHILVKNEARFVWYSVMSVINYVDRIRLWDTGSSDQTLQIIDEIKKTKEAKSKDIFEVKKLNINKFNEAEIRQKMVGGDFTDVRQEMLEVTTADWFLVVDADEIWWDSSIKNVITQIRTRGEHYDSLVVPTINLTGDMYHFQEEKAGRYHLAGRVGHYNLRGIRRSIQGLHAKGDHGVFGWADKKEKMIENRDQSRVLFLDSPYLHATHLRRSSFEGGDKAVFKRSRKLKYDLGKSFPKDFYYPEVFFRQRPSIVPSVWKVSSASFKFRALFETPLKYVYRRTLLPFKKHGY